MVTNRSRWTAAQARVVLEELEASGKSVASFARERGLHPVRLLRWRAQLRRKAPGVGPRLVELVARQPVACGSLRVLFPSGHILEIADVDFSTGLRAVLTILNESSAC